MQNLKYFLVTLIIICTISHSQSKGGYWSFSGNGDDTAAWDNSDNPGNLINSASYSSESGNNGSYLKLDTVGANDYLLIPDDQDLDFDNENIGISFWIYPTLLNDVHYIINKGDQYDQPKTTNYSVRISKSNKIEFLIRDQNDQAQKVSTSFVISPNMWQFIAVYYDYTNKVVYFWNENKSEATESVGFETIPISNNDPLAIGSWYVSQPANSSIKDYEGWIDEVRISGRKEDLFPSQQTVDIASENSSKADIQFSLYPNPISKSNGRNNLKINFNIANKNEYLIKIYSILGREVYSKSFNSTETDFQFNLPIKNIKSGVYFISLINAERTQTKKLLILK